jgi:hypothetical protein
MDDSHKKIVIDTLDYTGVRVIFTEKKLVQKKQIHPELRKPSFIRRVKKTIENPDEVWRDYSDRKRRRCHYKKYSQFTYAKVVIWIADNPCEVVTAFEIDYIKEASYPELEKLL